MLDGHEGDGCHDVRDPLVLRDFLGLRGTPGLEGRMMVRMLVRIVMGVERRGMGRIMVRGMGRIMVRVVVRQTGRQLDRKTNEQ